MSEDIKTAVSLSILGKEYLIGCTAEEREDLALSADYLNKKLEEQRRIGKVIGNEKTAIITALNITSDYLKLLKVFWLELVCPQDGVVEGCGGGETGHIPHLHLVRTRQDGLSCPLSKFAAVVLGQNVKYQLFAYITENM